MQLPLLICPLHLHTICSAKHACRSCISHLLLCLFCFTGAVEHVMQFSGGKTKGFFFSPCSVSRTQPVTAPGLSCTANGKWLSKEMCRKVLLFPKMYIEFMISWRFIINIQKALQVEGIWETCSKTEIPLLPFSYLKSCRLALNKHLQAPQPS